MALHSLYCADVPLRNCSLLTEHHQRLQGQVVYPVQGTHSLNFQVNFICGLKCAYATTQSCVYYCNTTQHYISKEAVFHTE